MRRRSRYLLLLLLGLSVASILAASPARSDERAVGIPGINICPKVAPISVSPITGLAGALGERPIHITTDSSPEHIWSTGGFAGFERSSYDLGCAANPTSYLKMAKANVDNTFANAFIGAGEMITALTDSLDRRAWSPQWVTAFLGDFAQRASETIKTVVLGSLLGLGLLIASIMLIIKHRGGDMAGASSAVAWVLFVCVVISFVLASPTLASKMSQQGGAMAISSLNNGSNVSDSQTNRIVEAVQYQSWLRRTFGTETSPMAKKYGPALLMSERVTWAELDTVNKDPSNAAKALYDLRKQKQNDFDEIAAKVKKEDPGAYMWLTGENNAGGLVILEMCYAMVASFFRLAVDLLMITCAIMLTVLALVWAGFGAYIVTPVGRWLGVLLLNNTVRGVGYVITSAVGSWMFSIYAQVAMEPGESAWWSLVLLFLGTVVAWTLIRPDRKMLSLLSMGQVRGSGTIMRSVGKMLMAYVGGRVAGAAAAKAINEDEPVVSEDRSEDQSTPWGYNPDPMNFGTIDPAEPVERSTGPAVSAYAEYVDAEDVSETLDVGRGLPRGAYSMPAGLRELPASQDIYQRPEEPVDAEIVDFTPPPSDSVGEVEIYQRPASGDPEDEYVTCPWCEGSGCGHCENEGVVPRWVRRETLSGWN